MTTPFDNNFVLNTIRATKFRFFKAALSQERAASMIVNYACDIIDANTPEINADDAKMVMETMQKQAQQRANTRDVLLGMRDMVAAHYDSTKDDDAMLIENLEVEIDRALAQVEVDEDENE